LLRRWWARVSARRDIVHLDHRARWLKKCRGRRSRLGGSLLGRLGDGSLGWRLALDTFDLCLELAVLFFQGIQPLEDRLCGRISGTHAYGVGRNAECDRCCPKQNL